jgi:hypothetical protein
MKHVYSVFCDITEFKLLKNIVLHLFYILKNHRDFKNTFLLNSYVLYALFFTNCSLRYSRSLLF